MIKNFGEIKNQVVVRSGIQTTLTYITDTMLADWIQGATTWASGYHKWPFTEGRVSTTFTTGAGANSDEWSFEGYKADSFRFIQVGGKRFQKLNFEDYQNYLENEPQGSDYVYSDYGRLVYVNPHCGVSGTLTAYGQFLPAVMDITDPTATTVFSNNDEEGNEAIVNEALYYLKLRERKLQEADYHHNKAIEILENVWKKYEDEQSVYQTKNRGMFERFDVLYGDYFDDSLNENQF